MLRSAKEVEAKIRAGKPGRWAVGNGAYLQVAKVANRSTASWLARYQLNGKAREMGLGPVALVTLAEAREKASNARKLLLDGVDPLEARKSAIAKTRLDAAKARNSWFASNRPPCLAVNIRPMAAVSTTPSRKQANASGSSSFRSDH